ncbi:MAG: endonuclease/exonuclease/phosphatase family protein [Gemmatimonadota bacterium]
MTIASSGCHVVTNYPDPVGPRYAGTVRDASPPEDTLVVVTFNVEHGERVLRAIEALRADSVTREADIVLLQEMDAAGTRRVAEALAMDWVYYPAREGRDGDDVGNAVLSRWPIVEDEKLVLPHLAVFGGSQRIATAATVRIGGSTLRVYSVHLATPVNLTPGKREDQLHAVLEDAAAYPRVVIGGDLNSHGLGHGAVERGYAWPTRDGPATVFLFRWDHILHRGLQSPPEAAGTVLDNRGASDHRPVWARVALDDRPVSAAFPGTRLSNRGGQP